MGGPGERCLPLLQALRSPTGISKVVDDAPAPCSFSKVPQLYFQVAFTSACQFPLDATGKKRLERPDQGDMSSKADRPSAEDLAFAVHLLP